jgi:hypothetical protein
VAPPSDTRHDRLPITWRVAAAVFSWNTVLRVAGLCGVVNEAWFKEVDRPTLLLLFAAMMGLPSFLPKQLGGGGKP